MTSDSGAGSCSTGSHVSQIGKLRCYGTGKAHFHAKRFPMSAVCLLPGVLGLGTQAHGQFSHSGAILPSFLPLTGPCPGACWTPVFLPVQVICSLRAELSLAFLPHFICISLRS